MTSAGDRWGDKNAPKIFPWKNPTKPKRNVSFEAVFMLGWLPRLGNQPETHVAIEYLVQLTWWFQRWFHFTPKKTARTSPCLFLRDSMMLHLRCIIFWSQSICMCFLAVQCEVCVFISTDMGLSFPVSPFHHVDALPICRVVSKSCKGSTGGFGRWPRRSGGKSAPCHERWANDSQWPS